MAPLVLSSGGDAFRRRASGSLNGFKQPDSKILRFKFGRSDWRPRWPSVRWWTAAHTKTAANALRWWRSRRSAVAGGKPSNSGDIAGRVQIENRTADVEKYIVVAQKRKQWLILLFTNTKRKWKGCGRGNGEFGCCRFRVGFRSSLLPSNNLSARPTDLLSAHGRRQCYQSLSVHSFGQNGFSCGPPRLDGRTLFYGERSDAHCN